MASYPTPGNGTSLDYDSQSLLEEMFD